MATNLFKNIRTREGIETKAFEPKMEIGRHTMICVGWTLKDDEIKVNSRGEEYLDKAHHEFTFRDVKTKDEDVLRVSHTIKAEQWFLGKVNKRTKGDLAIKCRPSNYLDIDPEDFGIIAQYLNKTPIEMIYDESYFAAPDGRVVMRNPHLQIELPEDNKPIAPIKSWHA